MKTRRIVLVVVAIVVVGFVVLQLLPVGNFSPLLQFPGNPAVAQAIEWDSPQTEALLRRACLDCHSNETTWPWYSRIAPVSWLVYKDVNEGRRELNFSELTTSRNPGRLVDEIGERVYRDMPPQIYTVIHPDAVLTDAEKQALVDGVAKTFSTGTQGSTVQPEGAVGGSGDGDSDND